MAEVMQRVDEVLGQVNPFTVIQMNASNEIKYIVACPLKAGIV
jgi:hypothetical protein